MSPNEASNHSLVLLKSVEAVADIMDQPFYRTGLLRACPSTVKTLQCAVDAAVVTGWCEDPVALETLDLTDAFQRALRSDMLQRLTLFAPTLARLYESGRRPSSTADGRGLSLWPRGHTLEVQYLADQNRVLAATYSIH